MRAFDALVGLQLFDHNFHRAHQALRLPGGKGVHRYHPFMIVLAHSMFVLGLLCFTLIESVVFEFANPILLGLLPKNSTLPEDEYGKINTQCKRVGESPAGQRGVPQCNEQHRLY